METPEGTTGCWSPSLPSFLLGVTAAFLGYYWMCICKKPTIVSSKPLRLLLERYCPVASEKFYPTIWCFEGRMQTALWIHFVRKPIMSYRNEVIAAEDGGQLSLDWKDNEESSQFPDGATRPIAIILPGLNGNSQKIYILNLVKTAMEAGYRAVVINNRGFGGEQVLTPKTLCVGYTLDMRTVVCHLRRMFPEAPLVAVGSSLGAVILLNYLADYGASSHLQAAVSLSPLWNLFQSDVSLSEPLNHWLLHKTIIQGVKKTMRRYCSVISQKVDVDHVLEAQTLREYDERYTAPAYDYQSCDEYYHKASPDHRLGEIRTPVLCLCSLDDPFSPSNAIPLAEVSANPCVALLITTHGGHIGFLEDLIPNHQRYMDRVFRQFVVAVLKQWEELKMRES
ncbi:abhydrolase domain containing 1 S homeolog [Xenopus laevis]|uniref:Phospholipase ABHD3 n=1 Tax=Xenopus laevis TaxID=8355 RepID=Q32NS5_XENLA|nr:abhydrolase domain containing 1 S homeolog [Xenopus laevis]AAI08502.1 MGC130857 protein [Xenopus laevis]